MKINLIITVGILLLVSCSNNDELTNGKMITSTILQEIKINNGDTLRINLGSFGDEEGAWIFENPRNAKINKLFRNLSSGIIFYEYSPLENFTGKDTVGLILNRGSDGASPGFNDTTRICIVTE